ncbi:MAG: TonB-dependent receptor [Bacteroidetes bacterium]|nr:MAG: TonB-dependent receptor [Bacteroidota bacterium]
MYECFAGFGEFVHFYALACLGLHLWAVAVGFDQLYMKKITFALFSLFLLFSFIGRAQYIEGQLTDKHRQKPVRFAQIEVLNTAITTSSDRQGRFTIRGLPAGSYTLRISHEGYHPVDYPLDLMYDEPTQVKVCLKQKLLHLNDQLVQTARRYERDAFYSSESVSAYEQRQLEQQAARSTPEALQGLTGMWLQQASLGMGAPVIRGLSGSRSLILIDGIRLSTPLASPAPFSFLSTVDPAQLSRVELLRGSGATQYGNGAMGGVLQLFTRTPSYSRQGVEVHGSWQGKWLSRGMELGNRASLQISTPAVAVLGGFSYSEFGHLMAGNGRGSRQPTAYLQRGGDLKARFRLGSRHQLTLAYQQQALLDLPHYEQVAFHNYSQYQSDPLKRQLAYARWESHLASKWLRKIQFTGSYQDFYDNRSQQMSGREELQRFRNQLNSWGAVLEIHSQPIPQWNIVSGIEYYHDELKSEAWQIGQEVSPLSPEYADGARTDNLSFFSVHTLDILKLRLSFGGRANVFALGVDDPGFGMVNFTPKAFTSNFSALYPLSRHFHMVASLNSGYRMPNMYELSQWGAFDGGIEAPNKLLGHEKSFTSEIGIKAKSGRYAGSIVLYRSRLTDLMERIPALYQGYAYLQGARVYQRVNLSQAFVQGIEAELELPLFERVLIYGNVNYTYGNEVNAAAPMSYIPPLHGKAGLRYQDRKGFWSKAEWFYAADQDRISPEDAANPLIPESGSPAWQVVNVFVGYDVGYDFGWCSASLGVLNLLNEGYRMHGSALDGYGRSVRASLKLRF